MIQCPGRASKTGRRHGAWPARRERAPNGARVAARERPPARQIARQIAGQIVAGRAGKWRQGAKVPAGSLELVRRQMLII